MLPADWLAFSISHFESLNRRLHLVTHGNPRGNPPFLRQLATGTLDPLGIDIMASSRGSLAASARGASGGGRERSIHSQLIPLFSTAVSFGDYVSHVTLKPSRATLHSVLL